MLEAKNDLPTPTKFRAMFDLHEGLATNVGSKLSVVMPRLSSTELFAAIALLRHLPRHYFDQEWNNLNFNCFQEDFTSQISSSFSNIKYTLYGLLSPNIDNSEYLILEKQKTWVNTLKGMGIPSTIFTGALKSDKKLSEIEDIINRSDAQGLLDPSCPVLMRPSFIRHSGLEKALYTALRWFGGEYPIVFDNDPHVIDTIDAVNYGGLSKRPLLFLTIPKEEAMEILVQDSNKDYDLRKLPMGAERYIDRQNRYYIDDFDLLIDKIKKIQVENKSERLTLERFGFSLIHF